MTFARNYAKTGDSQVVARALHAIVKINSAYIKAKGRTFYSHTPLVNDNRSSDGIVTHTLEAYRQNIRNAVAINDETEIMQFLSGLGLLTVEYSRIQYPRSNDSLYHASLAKGYMTQEVLQMLPQFQKALQEMYKELEVMPALAAEGAEIPPAAVAILEGLQKFTDIRVPALAIYAVPHNLGPAAFRNDEAGKAAFEARDAARAEAQAKEFESGVPSARVVRLPHANHFVFLSNEADVLREMHAFLDGLH